MYHDGLIRSVPTALVQNPALPTPHEIAKDLVLLEVMHYDFDQQIKTGQIIVHQLVLHDVRQFFLLAYMQRFPIHSVIPVSQFGWDDNASCAANNSSGHNLRYLKDGRMSKHGIGCAFDINPRQNPCFDLSEAQVHEQTIPPDGVYIPGTAGTLQKGHPLVRQMVQSEWTWGGGWDFPVDYQHFQIVPDELASWVK